MFGESNASYLQAILWARAWEQEDMDIIHIVVDLKGERGHGLPFRCKKKLFLGKKW